MPVVSAGAAPVEYAIGTFNMAGGNDEHGGKGDEAPDALVRSVRDRSPAFVTVQEGCEDWSDRLRRQLPDYTVRFDEVLARAPEPGRPPQVAQCRHPSKFGNAILYRNDFGIDGDPVGHGLGSPATFEQREMLCVPSHARKIVVCSAHLTNGDDSDRLEARRAEARVAAGILATTYAGYTTFLAGDLNDDPLSAATDDFYHPYYRRGAHGGFKEVDSPCGNDMREFGPFGLYCRSGEPTHGIDKIDYLFVTPTVYVRWADATFALHSDHDPLWAGVSLL